MKVKVYVSNEKKVCADDIEDKDFMKIRKIEKTDGGVIFTFNDYDSAYRVAQLFMNSGYETVRIIGKE